MNALTIIRTIAICGIFIACNESSEPTLSTDIENTTLATNLQGNWVKIVENQTDKYQQIDLKFEGTTLYWRDSTVTTKGKYAVARSGSNEVKFLTVSPEVIEKYLMGRPPITVGLKDVMVSDWRGSQSYNRNYRNAGNSNGWQIINEWKSAGSGPPIHEAVYVKFDGKASEVTFELDGSGEDYVDLFARQ